MASLPCSTSERDFYCFRKRNEASFSVDKPFDPIVTKFACDLNSLV